ncbi:lysyl-tRNA synthetase, class II [Nematocida homosporus]|uniref:lysyl-tRNA synthetase, class II n=1 Tax=Nematocida homosporus TaxID=1912981 RepID=UPI002220FA3E|nr:lysyl-tRNA synthetase, class II [Nematocida homosporus]KAI5186096.1 lysyl-tRNA synthetase, class II [Nematocida homosporus]
MQNERLNSNSNELVSESLLRTKIDKKDKKSLGLVSSTETSTNNSRGVYLASRIAAGEVVYPYDFKETMSISAILSWVSSLEISMEKEKEMGILSQQEVKTGGRVIAIRSIGKITFIKIESMGMSIQVIRKEKVRDIYRGDILGVSGSLGYSNKGELSIMASELRVLSPCVHTYPTEHYGLKDTELCYRQRYLDLVLNKVSLERFIVRNKVVKYIRSFLDQRGFLEVETPMMQVVAGGAAAKPFKTLLNEMGLDLNMRISPELFLKTLLVGGIPRVYELGRQFRNEGIDATHNPEFTTCEFYMAYADYNDVLHLTEEMIVGMVESLFGSRQVKYLVEGREGKEAMEVSLDFSTPFKCIDILSGLSAELGVEITGEILEQEEGRILLDRLCTERGVMCRAPRTTARLLDKLVGEYLESKCVNPTFLMNHPKIMSPLAKEHRSRKGVTERFELFMLGKEVCNAYTELNDPFDQRQRFEQQARDKSAGDEEAQEIDEDFCTALEYGMPPAGGWGIGIDRLVMMLTGAPNIRDVLFFPTMRPK